MSDSFGDIVAASATTEMNYITILNTKWNVNSVVFKNGNSLAVRLVGDCRLPQGTKVREYRDKNRIVIERLSGWPASFMAALGAWDEDLPRHSSRSRDPYQLK